MSAWLDKPCIEHGQEAKRYGHTKRNGTSRGLHVWALIDFSGQQPEGRYACHHCDNPRCIEPAYLYWGTPAQNIQDSITRGRYVHAGGHPRKLTSEQVQDIKMSSKSSRALAKDFGVSQSVVMGILQGHRYKEIA